MHLLDLFNGYVVESVVDTVVGVRVLEVVIAITGGC